MGSISENQLQEKYDAWDGNNRISRENEVKKRANPLCNYKFCPAKEGDDLCEECGSGFGNNSWHP